jgi:hypothetical protein
MDSLQWVHINSYEWIDHPPLYGQKTILETIPSPHLTIGPVQVERVLWQRDDASEIADVWSPGQPAGRDRGPQVS